MAKRDRNRQQELRSFRNLCETTGFRLEPHQVKIAAMLLGPEGEKLVTLPRKNGKSRLVGAFAAHHLLTTPEAQVIVVANSKEQAEIIDRYARQVAMHPSVEQQFEPRFRELRGPDGSTLTVKSADAGRLLGLTPTLVLYDEFCVAKDDEIYTALRSALLPGATMAVVSTAGWGAESPMGRLRARCLGQPDIRVRGFLTDARGENIRMLQWMVPEDVGLDDYQPAKKANPLSLITPRWLKEQREALHEIDYQRFHLNRWVGRIGSWLPAGSWQSCANGQRPQEGCPIWIGVDLGGARADSACVWVSRLGDEHFAVDAAIFSGEDGVVGVNETILRLAERFQIREVLFDPWRAQVLVRGTEKAIAAHLLAGAASESAPCMGEEHSARRRARLLVLVHSGRLTLDLRDARNHAKGAPRVEQARGLLAEVIVHANMLAGDLVARGGIRGLDFACLGQHLVDVAVRNQHSAGGVGEHVLAGHHAYALGDYWNIWLKRRKLSPPQRVASPEQ